MSLARVFAVVALVCLLSLLPTCSLAQNSSSPSPNTAAQTSDAQTTSSEATVSDTKGPITKAQAKDLFRSLDEILKFDSDDTKLPILHPVKRKLTSREAVNKYILKKFDEDESAKRLQRSEIVLKKFGLLDRDFHLGPFLVSLLTEQIAGFYDNKTKTVNLLDWIPAEQQKPVMAHELTHALQDQHVDLEKWGQQGATGIAKNSAEDSQHIATDETDDTRDAVLEGQAMLVFVDYSLQPYGKTVLSAPDMVRKFAEGMGDYSDSPVMTRAPLLLQQTMMFPYREGLAFEETLLLGRGAERAFAGTLDRPPTSSYEIMNPQSYLAHQPVPLLHLPDIHPLIDKDYSPYDVGVMGALDVRILTQLFGGEQASDALTPAWDGGLYYAAQRKSAATGAQKGSTASLALMYFSRWKNSDSARTFARVYADQLPRKYSTLKRRKADEAQIDAGIEREEQLYTTNEGDVLMVLSGRNVFISEGFDVALARQLQALVVGAQSEGPIGIAALHQSPMSAPASELALPLAAMFRNAGAMKAGLPLARAASR